MKTRTLILTIFLLYFVSGKMVAQGDCPINEAIDIEYATCDDCLSFILTLVGDSDNCPCTMSRFSIGEVDIGYLVKTVITNNELDCSLELNNAAHFSIQTGEDGSNKLVIDKAIPANLSIHEMNASDLRTTFKKVFEYLKQYQGQALPIADTIIEAFKVGIVVELVP